MASTLLSNTNNLNKRKERNKNKKLIRAKEVNLFIKNKKVEESSEEETKRKEAETMIKTEEEIVEDQKIEEKIGIEFKEPKEEELHIHLIIAQIAAPHLHPALADHLDMFSL